MVEFAVLHPTAGRHVLQPAAVHVALVAHAVFVGQSTLHHVGHDFSIAVWVRPEASQRLHEVVVHDPQRPEVGVRRIAVFREREMKARLEPVAIGP